MQICRRCRAHFDYCVSNLRVDLNCCESIRYRSLCERQYQADTDEIRSCFEDALDVIVKNHTNATAQKGAYDSVKCFKCDQMDFVRYERISGWICPDCVI